MNFKFLLTCILVMFISCMPVSMETEIAVASEEVMPVEQVADDLIAQENFAESAVSYEVINDIEYEVTTYSMYVTSNYWTQNCPPNRGAGSFQAALSHKQWTGMAWHQTLYLFGQSINSGGQQAPTYITGLQVYLSDGWNWELVYSENYTLLDYGNTRAVAELYSFINNPVYQIQWTTATPL